MKVKATHTVQDVPVIPEGAKNAARVCWYSLVADVAGSECDEKEPCESQAGTCILNQVSAF